MEEEIVVYYFIHKLFLYFSSKQCEVVVVVKL